MEAVSHRHPWVHCTKSTIPAFTPPSPYINTFQTSIFRLPGFACSITSLQNNYIRQQLLSAFILLFAHPLCSLESLSCCRMTVVVVHHARVCHIMIYSRRNIYEAKLLLHRL